MSIENLIAGQRVRFVNAKLTTELTVGGKYTVLAGVGDADLVCGGVVNPSGMVIADDTGHLIYCHVPSGIRGDWELVDENQ